MRWFSMLKTFKNNRVLIMSSFCSPMVLWEWDFIVNFALKYYVIMKLLVVFTLIAFSLGSTIFGQKVTFEKALLSKYSEKELNQMAVSNPQELAFLNEFVKTGFYVTDFPKGKEAASELSGARKIEDISDIDFFKLNIEIKENEFQYFTILGTDKLLVVKSKGMVIKEMNK